MPKEQMRHSIKRGQIPSRDGLDEGHKGRGLVAGQVATNLKDTSECVVDLVELVTCTARITVSYRDACKHWLISSELQLGYKPEHSRRVHLLQRIEKLASTGCELQLGYKPEHSKRAHLLQRVGERTNPGGDRTDGTDWSALQAAQLDS